MSDQNIDPLCILDAVATTFSTAIGTRSKPCSFRSASRIECLLEMMRNAALWSVKYHSQGQKNFARFFGASVWFNRIKRHHLLTHCLATPLVRFQYVSVGTRAKEAFFRIRTQLRTRSRRIAPVQVHTLVGAVQYLSRWTRAHRSLKSSPNK